MLNDQKYPEMPSTLGSRVMDESGLEEVPYSFMNDQINKANYYNRGIAEACMKIEEMHIKLFGEIRHIPKPLNEKVPEISVQNNGLQGEMEGQLSEMSYGIGKLHDLLDQLKTL